MPNMGNYRDMSPLHKSCNSSIVNNALFYVSVVATVTVQATTITRATAVAADEGATSEVVLSSVLDARSDIDVFVSVLCIFEHSLILHSFVADVLFSSCTLSLSCFTVL